MAVTHCDFAANYNDNDFTPLFGPSDLANYVVTGESETHGAERRKFAIILERTALPRAMFSKTQIANIVNIKYNHCLPICGLSC
jgi:hypothetical protein